MNGYLDMVQLLFANKPELANQNDNEGKTPIQIARESGYTEISDWLEAQQQPGPNLNAVPSSFSETSNRRPPSPDNQPDQPDQNNERQRRVRHGG